MNSSSLLSEATLLAALSEVIDPEIGANIVDLGLVYGLDIQAQRVIVEMTMTSVACPMGELIQDEVDWALREALPDGVEPEIRLVWAPAWTPARMSARLKLQLGWSETGATS